MKHYPARPLMCMLFTVMAAAGLGGCAGAGARVVYGTGYLATEPQAILVRPFAISVEEAGRDRDILPSWVLRNARSQLHVEGDLEFGRVAAHAVAAALVDELAMRGITVSLADASALPAAQSTVITGQFVDLDSGTGTVRPAIGFTVKTGYQARVQIIQKGQVATELAVYAKATDPAAARDMAAQIAHQIQASYRLHGWQ